MSSAERLDAAADWLQRLQTSPRDEALIARWGEWCQADPENLRAFESLEALWDALDSPQTRTLLPLSIPPARRNTSRAWALAASIFLALGSALFIYWNGQASQVDRLATTTAEHESRVLADGSRVELGAQTQLIARYDDNRRRITLGSGEAFFEVAKDPARPFIVRAGALEVTAIGTAFSVRHLNDRTTVIVNEGVVRIRPIHEGRGGTASPLRAGAGERVSFNDSTSQIRVARVDPGSAVSWRNGILKFVDEPLGSVVDDVNRYTHRRIAIDDPALRDLLYTGTIYQDRIDDWVNALEEVFPLEAVSTDNGVSLERKKK
jgi:transmembrane sensor